MSKRNCLVCAACALFIAAALSPQIPNVTAALDAGALTPNLAPGSVFAVKGTGLSAAGFFQPGVLPYPAVLNGVRIPLTPASGGAAVDMMMVYDYNIGGVNQLAAVIPSTVPPGDYDVRVINGEATSAPFRTTVLARKPGIVTADASGSGMAQATLEGRLILQRDPVMGKIGDFDARPAHPGDRMDLWGTGPGADVAADSGAGTPGYGMDPGAFTVTGPGASAVGAFRGNFAVPPEYMVAGTDAFKTVNRASGLAVTWTGGDPDTLVFISGSSFTTSASGVTTSATFQCCENNTAGRSTVPVSVLQQLPASSTFSAGPVTVVMPGSPGVSSISEQVRAPAPGIDIFSLASSYNYSFTLIYQ